MQMKSTTRIAKYPLLAAVTTTGAILLSACGGGSTPAQKCETVEGDPAPEFLRRIGCNADFVALASVPLSSSIPGARSGKVVLDTFDGTLTDQLYFQNSLLYPIHYLFADKHLSVPDHRLVPKLAQFNQTEYYAPEGQRRFILGSVTYYEGPKIWALEIAPYDTATAPMIQKLYDKVRGAVYFGGELKFHPTSEAVAAVAKMLPASVKIATTDDIFAKIDYQPLNLGTSMGKLRFVKAADLGKIYLNFRDIVVLDRVPNDISAVVGMITEEFQTPLAHVNVLAQNRGTPNMGLRGAMTNAKLRALEGQWIEFTVGAFEWDAKMVSQEQADAWWEANKPPPVPVPEMDISQTELKDIEKVTDESTAANLGEAIKTAILAFGGKAANYSVLKQTDGVPIRKAFAVPVFYYDQFMKQNGFYARVDALLADKEFQNEPAIRDMRLAQLRADMENAPVDPTFSALLKAKMEKDFPGMKMRFRTSTNAEDQEDFLCAGCYDSHTGDPSNWDVERAECKGEHNNSNCSVLQAVRKTWAGVWYFRTYEERSYNSIDQKRIGMALLVHHNFADEEANGVAVTANIFDDTGVDPGFYMNVQKGGNAEVVAPPPGVTSDEAILYFDGSLVTTSYLSHSNLIAKGTYVLTSDQILSLAKALAVIQKRFSPAYGPLAGNNGFYGLEVDFKFDDEDNLQPGLPPQLLIKQARNYRGRAANK